MIFNPVIKTGLPGDVRAITVTADPPEGGSVSGGGMAQDGMTVAVRAQPNVTDDFYLDGWRENGALAATRFAYTFPVRASRNLIAAFAKANISWQRSFPLRRTGRM